jgi:hypothetical protein
LALDDQANEIQQDRMLAAFAVAENGDNSEGAPRGTARYPAALPTRMTRSVERNPLHEKGP